MSTSPMIVITNFFGTKINAANAGVGLKNPDGTLNHPPPQIVFIAVINQHVDKITRLGL